MQQNYRFPTQSRYDGSWNKALGSMEGYGCYTFPDGSVYHGYFSKGRFQGYGTLKLFHPQKFTIKGTFVQGKCTQIHELHFGDGLEFNGTFNKDGTLNANEWNYCTHNNRLYFNEIRLGIEPPGPNAFLTAQRKARIIPKGTYDTSDGIYNPSTGFTLLTENTGEKSKLRYVSCIEDREYIKKHYRISKGIDDTGEPTEPSPELSQQILSDNIRAMCHRKETASCKCRNKLERDRYYNTLCPEHLRESKKDEKQELEMPGSDIELLPTSSTVESFGVAVDPCEEDVTLQQQNLRKKSLAETVGKPQIRGNQWHRKEGISAITKFSIVNVDP